MQVGVLLGLASVSMSGWSHILPSAVGVYCPRGSAAPTPVAPGYYSIGRGSNAIHNTVDSSDRADTDDTEAHHTRIDQSICEE